MAEQPVVYTFHKIRERCEQPDPGAWRAFLTFYSPLCLRLLAVYLPEEGASAPRIWERTLQALAENDFERVRAAARKSEREFLADVRALLLDHAADHVSSSPPAENASARSRVDLGQLGKLLEGLPLLHQEMLFLKLAGYGDATLEGMFRIAPRVAAQAFDRLLPDYAAARNIEQDGCPWSGEWLALLRQARAARTEKCPELFQFLRIQDGQVSWYEKEPAEKHVAGCRHCLEAWTALREVGYWRHTAPPLPAAKIEQFLRVLPLGVAAPDKPNKSLLRRFFG
jgi:hypothetical protein